MNWWFYSARLLEIKRVFKGPYHATMYGNYEAYLRIKDAKEMYNMGGEL